MKLLREHVKEKHGKDFCMRCVGGRKCFVREQVAYTPQELRAHGRAEHPVCEYCRLAVYDSDALYKHMQDAHFLCHVCDGMWGEMSPRALSPQPQGLPSGGMHHDYHPIAAASTLTVRL